MIYGRGLGQKCDPPKLPPPSFHSTNPCKPLPRTSPRCIPLLPMEDAFLAHHTQDHCNENSCACAKRIQLPLILLRSITWSRGRRRLALQPCQRLEVLEAWTECVYLGVVGVSNSQKWLKTHLLSKYFMISSPPWFTPTPASSSRSY